MRIVFLLELGRKNPLLLARIFLLFLPNVMISPNLDFFMTLMSQLSQSGGLRHSLLPRQNSFVNFVFFVVLLAKRFNKYTDLQSSDM